jgi:hypothetical protein
MRLLVTLVVSACLLPAQIKSPTKDTAGGDPMVDLYRSLADWSRMSERAIYAIRDRIGNDKEVAAVLLVTKRSSASANNVIDARKAGKDWAAITKQWNVKQEGGGDFADYANAVFLSEYHARPIEETRKLQQKGMDAVAINQEFRREGAPANSGTRSRGSTRQTPQ